MLAIDQTRQRMWIGMTDAIADVVQGQVRGLEHAHGSFDAQLLHERNRAHSEGRSSLRASVRALTPESRIARVTWHAAGAVRPRPGERTPPSPHGTLGAVQKWPEFTKDPMDEVI